MSINMEEKPNLLKYIKGFISPLTGIKSTVYIFWAFLFFIVGYTVYRAYIKKQPPTTTQNAEHIDAPNYYLQPHAFGCARLLVPEKK